MGSLLEKTGSVAYDWVIIDNFKLTYYGFEEWNGTDDAILPSIKYGGSYSAHTKLFNADYDYGDGQTNNAHFNQIVGTPDNDGSSKAWYAADYTMTDWTYGNSALPNFCDGKPADTGETENASAVVVIIGSLALVTACILAVLKPGKASMSTRTGADVMQTVVFMETLEQMERSLARADRIENDAGIFRDVFGLLDLGLK